MIFLKKFIKKLIPPIFYDVRNILINKSNESMWNGSFKNWEEATRQCTGYDNELIISKCFKQMLEIKSGNKIYERDSVLFDKIQYSFGLLIGLYQSAANNNGQISVLDFGGSLGSSYFQNKTILNSFKIKWGIVEQENFVKCGRNNFQTKELMFFSCIEDCVNAINPKIILLSSVIQYLESPIEFIKKINELKIEKIIIDRTSFVKLHTSILTIQKVDTSIYNASYPCWFFNYENIINEFSNYNLILDFESYCDPSQLLNGIYEADWKGFILNLK
jgi:putative methyltransferase (TIGR04325 family)